MEKEMSKIVEISIHFANLEDAIAWRRKLIKFKENPAPLNSGLLGTCSKKIVAITEPK